MRLFEIKGWIATLKPGDVVGVYEFMGRIFVHSRKVERITPSGRVILESGSVFKPDGDIYANKNGRRIAPPPSN